jgi:hypothetical protein
MSTTVVGACILAALITGKQLLKAGTDLQTYESKHDGQAAERDEGAMDIDMAPETQCTTVTLCSRPLYILQMHRGP